MAAGRRGATVSKLAGDRRVAAPGTTPEAVAAALADLLAAGKAADHEGRWFTLTATGWRAGEVERLEEGDALVKPLGERRAAWVVDRRHRHGALPGDRVLVEPLAGAAPPAGEDLAPAAVVRRLARRHQRLVGTLEEDEEGRRWLAPFDAGLPLEVEVLDGERVPEGSFAEVELVHGAGERAHPRARLIEVLGHPETPGIDTEVVLRHHGIPVELPADARAEAAALPAAPRPADLEGRLDLRHLAVVTIDGESSRDFDDALSLEPLSGGRVRLGVHIADVSHYVAAGGAIDRAAFERGTSVYYPDRVVPMLPEKLADDLCSLRPGLPRLTLSAFLDLDAAGKVVGRRFAETVIESKRRLTYTEVRRVLEEGKPRDALDYGEEVLALLGRLRELMGVLLARRVERGSLDFDLPEGDVVLDTDGVTVGILPQERHVAHRIVEEMMIAANEAVASSLAAAESPALYRIHEPPAAEDLAELASVLRPFGLAGELRRQGRGGDDGPPPSALLRRLLERAAGEPYEDFVTAVVLRTLKRAFYDPECRGHYALASEAYTHFTSPIRRYPDLVIHRRLKALLAAGGVAAGAAADHEPGSTLPLAERLPAIARHASFTERRAERSERDLLQWKKVRFLADRVGETFPGRITGVQAFGLFVQLAGLHVDGLVPVRTLGDEFFRFEPEAHRLVGDRTGRSLQLSDEVEVRLVGIDHRHRGLDLELAREGGTERRPAGRGKGRGKRPPEGRRREPERRRRGRRG